MAAARAQRRPPPPAPLAIGHRLGPYEVRSVLGAGAFGIVYRVSDPASEDDLAVKEYLPASLARREGQSAVVPRSPAEAEAFEQGLGFFVNEGKLLQQLDHPSLVKVHASWTENGTAYMAMRLYNGRTLHDTMATRWRPPREAGLRSMLEALLDPIEALHEAGLQHRDISPQTVVVELDDRLVLMDLGSPRRVTSALGETGPTGPRDGFAPPELYGRGDSQPKGPWTDLYELGALLHYMITGRAPAPAPERASHGDGQSLALKLWTDEARHSLEFLGIVDWMLALEPRDRPQSVAELRQALAGAGAPRRWLPSRRQRMALKLRRFKPLLWVGVALLVAVAIALGIRWALKFPLVQDWLQRF